jgi:hypothetical protein
MQTAQRIAEAAILWELVHQALALETRENMEYSAEELLPIVEKLTREYTSNESSSVTYETARMLMRAVLYCMDAYTDENPCENVEGSENGYELFSANEKPNAEMIYRRGYDRVVAKVYQAKEFYNGIIEQFQDFHCRNCRDTIIKGIPQFFLRYDPRFKPYDHILTLDYPTVKPLDALCGIDAISLYLRNIKTEWSFLNAFDPKRVEALLERIIPDYKNLFLDNISNAVLLTSIGCILAGKPVGMLKLQRNDMELIKGFFGDASEEKAEQKIRMLISKLFRSGFPENTELEEYFLSTSKEYAFRIVNGIKYNSLAGVFDLTDSMIGVTKADL